MGSSEEGSNRTTKEEEETEHMGSPEEESNRRRPTATKEGEFGLGTSCEEESQSSRRAINRQRGLVEASKWAGLVGGIWVQAFAGNAYTFAHFSDSLKHRLHYNQLQLNNLGVAKDFGENVGLLAGLLCNRLHPSILLSIGAFCGFVGYGSLWLVASHKIEKLPYWLMCVALCLGANSATWFNTGVLVTCMRNFPNSRGTVVGFLKGFVGLSGAIFTQLFIGFLSKDPVRLLFLLTVGPTIVCLISMGFIRPIPTHNLALDEHNPHEKLNFFVFNIICLTLAFFLLLATLFGDLIPLPQSFTTKFFTTIMLVLLVLPVCVPLRMLANVFVVDRDGMKMSLLPTNVESLQWKSEEKEEEEEGYWEIEEEGLRVINISASGSSSGSGSSTFPHEAKTKNEREDEDEDNNENLLAVAEGAIMKRKKGPRRGEDFELNQAMVKADFWLLFFSFFCGVGTGVTAINNLGQIGAAQGYTDVTMFVTLFGVFNFLGRLGGGSVSEYYIRLSATPRPVWMGAAQALMIVAHLLFASAASGSLLAASSILGFCYGVQFSVMVPTASELFGLRHFGIIYNVITMADPLGSFLFSGILAGYVYDWESEKQLSIHDDTCTGSHCFRLTFIIMAGICLVGVILCAILTSRIKVVYKGLYAGCNNTPNNGVSVAHLAKNLS